MIRVCPREGLESEARQSGGLVGEGVVGRDGVKRVNGRARIRNPGPPNPDLCWFHPENNCEDGVAMLENA